MNFGRFEVIAELGQGAMGKVYRAHDPVLDRSVALKTVSPALLSRKDTLKRFERTGQIALVSLIRIAVALDAAEPLQAWFQRPAFQTLDEALAATQPRQRGRAR